MWDGGYLPILFTRRFVAFTGELFLINSSLGNIMYRDHGSAVGGVRIARLIQAVGRFLVVCDSRGFVLTLLHLRIFTSTWYFSKFLSLLSLLLYWNLQTNIGAFCFLHFKKRSDT